MHNRNDLFYITKYFGMGLPVPLYWLLMKLAYYRHYVKNHERPYLIRENVH